MHAEYATAWLSGDGSPPPVEPAAVELVVDVFDACDPMLATPPLGDVPPQPATSTPLRSAPSPGRPLPQADGRRLVAIIGVFDVVLHVVSFQLEQDRALGRLYDIDGFGKVSPPGRWASPPAKPC